MQNNENNTEELKNDKNEQKNDAKPEITQENENEHEIAQESEMLHDEATSKENKIPSVFWLAGAAGIIGIVIVVSFITVLINLKTNYQKEEAIRILELIADKITLPTFYNVVKNLRDGEDLRTFAASINISPDDFSSLKYHKLSDFVYHKGGDDIKNHAEFYIEVKSSLDEPMTDMFGEQPKSRAKIDTNLILRLYSDGSIETVIPNKETSQDE